MENKNKFTCIECKYIFPMSEIETDPGHIIPGEDVCRMCMARAFYDHAKGDYKAMWVAQELINDILLERIELNIQYGVNIENKKCFMCKEVLPVIEFVNSYYDLEFEECCNDCAQDVIAELCERP